MMTGAAMPKAVPLRDDYSADDLRELARRTHDAKQARRLLALAGVREGLSRNEAARLGAMDAQALRRWVIAFNAEGPEGLVNSPPPGRPSKLSPAQKQEMAQLVDAGPDPEQDGVVRWRCVDLQQIIRDRYGVDLAENSVGRLLKELGFAHVSARARHPRQDPDAIHVFKKSNAARASHRDRRYSGARHAD